jgi:hypothetical protein
MKLNEIYLQILPLVVKASLKQKILFASFSTALILLVSSLFFYSYQTNYTALYQENALSFHEKTERRHLLEEMGIPYREGKRGEIEVPKEEVEVLRTQLLSSQESSKGFELFDTNTWIKGDKELQVLEMRALKGQLERDLAGFDSIQSARVSFDTAPAKKFSGGTVQAKASVILTLQNKNPLSWTQLHAVTAHMAGAVRGLEPHMVAVSDTQGRLYQIPDDTTENYFSRVQRLLIAEKMQVDVRSFLDQLIGSENYHLTLHGDEENLSLSLCYNERVPVEQQQLSDLLTKHLKHLTKNLDLDLSALPFCTGGQEKVDSAPLWGFFHIALFVLLLLGAPALYFFRFKEKKNRVVDEEKLTKIVPKINLEKLAKSLEREDPELIAWTLSYLEPHRAQKIMDRFPQDFQEEVMHHLSEMEREDF